MALPIETPSVFGNYKYQVCKDIMEKQQDATWTAVEVPVQKDKHEYLTVLDEDQNRLTTVTLQLFVEIEQAVGDLWLAIHNWYPHSDIQGMCIEFARMEKSVHAFFYQKMSDVLNIDPEETQEQQEKVITLRNKLILLKKITSNPSVNKPLTLATLAIIEQVLLFSNFAMLKSFKANGNNLIKNTLLGVDYVVDDETLHGVGAIGLYLAHTQEMGTTLDLPTLHNEIQEVVSEVLTHEYAVIDYTFGEAAEINGITPDQLKLFLRNRVSDTLSQLELAVDPIEGKDYIAEWFYRGNSAITIHDFFSAGTTQYSRTWDLDGFSILPHRKTYD